MLMMLKGERNIIIANNRYHGLYKIIKRKLAN